MTDRVLGYLVQCEVCPQRAVLAVQPPRGGGWTCPLCQAAFGDVDIAAAEPVPDVRISGADPLAEAIEAATEQMPPPPIYADVGTQRFVLMSWEKDDDGAFRTQWVRGNDLPGPVEQQWTVSPFAAAAADLAARNDPELYGTPLPAPRGFIDYKPPCGHVQPDPMPVGANPYKCTLEDGHGGLWHEAHSSGAVHTVMLGRWRRYPTADDAGEYGDDDYLRRMQG